MQGIQALTINTLGNFPNHSHNLVKKLAGLSLNESGRNDICN